MQKFLFKLRVYQFIKLFYKKYKIPYSFRKQLLSYIPTDTVYCYKFLEFLEDGGARIKSCEFSYHNKHGYGDCCKNRPKWFFWDWNGVGNCFDVGLHDQCKSCGLSENLNDKLS